jgi:hypothetical protein
MIRLKAGFTARRSIIMTRMRIGIRLYRLVRRGMWIWVVMEMGNFGVIWVWVHYSLRTVLVPELVLDKGKGFREGQRINEAWPGRIEMLFLWAVLKQIKNKILRKRVPTSSVYFVVYTIGTVCISRIFKNAHILICAFAAFEFHFLIIKTISEGFNPHSWSKVPIKIC